MKKRQELLGEIRELIKASNLHEVESTVEEFVDEVEDVFKDISDMLKKINIDYLDRISDAQIMAEEAASDLY